MEVSVALHNFVLVVFNVNSESVPFRLISVNLARSNAC